SGPRLLRDPLQGRRPAPRGARVRRLAEGRSLEALVIEKSGTGADFQKHTAKRKSAPVTDFRLKRQNQLSDVLRARHEAMRVGGLLEREGLEDLGPDLAGLDERPDLFPQVLREIGLELDRARAQRRAGH